MCYLNYPRGHAKLPGRLSAGQRWEREVLQAIIEIYNLNLKEQIFALSQMD